MILYWYIHWFWITILIVYTSVAQKLGEQESTTHSKTSNNSNDSTHSVEQNISNKTKNLQLEGTTAIPSMNVTVNKSSNWNASDQLLDNTTSVSVIEANVTSVSMASLLSNTSIIDNETLTTLETAYREPSDNESMMASDRIVTTDDSQLSAAGITSITMGCVLLVAIVCTLSYVWYRNRGFNRPQVLTDRSSNLDSSGYIDDTSVRDNSEEMYSLDNDSFLNSLEAMTIQNYWTDTVKHTKL